MYDRAHDITSTGQYPVWRQRDTAGRGCYLYFHRRWNGWRIGDVVDGDASCLMNPQTSSLPPTSGNKSNICTVCYVVLPRTIN